MADEILLTREGYEKIVKEHEELVSVRRAEVAEKIK
ncbi:MAG: transcription elongation factor GreA, partial [Firmicutes bacterium]|nr:transcription elongation factor GreA [Bacillota bacterium]